MPDNAAARHLAEAAGFAVEGVMRQAVFGDGRFHDQLLYTRLQPPPAAQNHPPTPPPTPPVHAVDASQIVIRPAHPDDVDDVAAMWRHPLVDRTTLQLPSQEIWHSRSRVGEAPPPGGHRLAAEDNGRVIGLITIFQNQNPRLLHSAGLGMMVHPEYWGLGVGSRLMEAILDIADNWLDLRRIDLEVNSDNSAAVGLYQKFGFEIEGTKRFHAFGDGRWADSHFMARIRE
ncbi:MAG: GNAT family N-acetyltransferase [Ardenticatenaceae bacterium]|nr:GNAT family N-acetyltransferase [Ardenticatenaceae bacterium]